MSRIGIVTLILIVLLTSVILFPASDQSNAQDPSIQTYTSIDGVFSFDYPAGWELQENSDGTLTLTGVDALSPSGNSIRMDIVQPESAIDPTTNEKETPEEIVAAFLESDFGGPLEFTDITRTSVGDKPAAFTTAPGSLNSSTLDFFFIAVDMGGDDTASILAQMVAGEIPIYQAAILAISGSFRLNVQTPIDTPTPEAPLATPTSDLPTPTPDSGIPTATFPPTVVATPQPSLVTVDIGPVESLTASYQSADGLFSFNHPADWLLNDGASVTLQILNAANPSQVDAYVEVTPPQSAFVLDYSGTGTAFGVMESFKSNMMQNYAFTDTLLTDVGGKRVAFVTSSVSYNNNTLVKDFLFAVVEVGGNNVALTYVEAPVGQLNTYLPTVFALVSTMSSSVPPAVPISPPVQPTTAPGTPQPTVEGATTVPSQPPPVIDQPAHENGRVVLFYSNGTMTIYNSSDTFVSIEGLELVTPDGNGRFISRDYGFYFQRVFAPDRCVHIHLNTQPFSAPSFCRRTGIRQLTYLFGDWDNLNFVWHSAFNPSGTFLVQRMGETLATCSIAAGECEFQAPVVYIAYDSRN